MVLEGARDEGPRPALAPFQAMNCTVWLGETPTSQARWPPDMVFCPRAQRPLSPR